MVAGTTIASTRVMRRETSAAEKGAARTAISTSRCGAERGERTSETPRPISTAGASHSGRCGEPSMRWRSSSFESSTNQ